MKKITLLLILLAVSFGYSQVIESFDGASVPTLSPDNPECAPNGIGMTVVATQASTAPNSLEIVTNAAAHPWQGAVLGLQAPLDLTTDLVVEVDVYYMDTGDGPLGILSKVTGSTDGGPDAASLQPHAGAGWQTLVFDFADAADGQSVANGTYPDYRIYPLYGMDTGDPYSQAHNASFDACTSLISPTIYVDNMKRAATASIKDYKIAGLNTYPNPTQNSWNVTTKDINMSSIQVFDVLGKNVLSMKPNLDKATIDGSNLKAGIYFAQVRTAEGSSSIKLIKQ